MDSQNRENYVRLGQAKKYKKIKKSIMIYSFCIRFIKLGNVGIVIEMGPVT